MEILGWPFFKDYDVDNLREGGIRRRPTGFMSLPLTRSFLYLGRVLEVTSGPLPVVG